MPWLICIRFNKKNTEELYNEYIGVLCTSQYNELAPGKHEVMAFEDDQVLHCRVCFWFYNLQGLFNKGARNNLI